MGYYIYIYIYITREVIQYLADGLVGAREHGDEEIHEHHRNEEEIDCLMRGVGVGGRGPLRARDYRNIHSLENQHQQRLLATVSDPFVKT